ncbi:MAG: 4Fe-4S dicluster domain-containing protein [Dissulfuribacterales bacterium]
MPDRQKLNTKSSERPDNPLVEIQQTMSACIQCGICTASCRNAAAMDFTPRRLWRLVLVGKVEEIFKSKTFVLCSACYTCTLRCPRGLPLTEVMDALKRLAAEKDVPVYRQQARFYRSFLNSVRRHGRLREIEFMTEYFILMKNPIIPFQFAPLGYRLMRRGKIPIMPSSQTDSHGLDALYDQVDLIEGES